MCAATDQTCNGALYPAGPMEIALAVWTLVKVSACAFGNGEGKIMTAFLVGDFQIAAGGAPLVSMRQNSVTASAKLGKKMGQFVAQSPINFVRVLKQPRV